MAEKGGGGFVFLILLFVKSSTVHVFDTGDLPRVWEEGWLSGGTYALCPQKGDPH